MLIDQNQSIPDELDMLSPRPAKPTKKRGNPERMAQVQVVSYLRRALPDGNVVFSIVNEQKGDGDKYQRARFGNARKASGVVTGVPDLCVIAPGYPVVWIEMKSAVGRLSDMQRHIHDKLRKAGQIVGVARSIEDAVAIMDQAGIPLRFRLAEG